MQPFTSNALAKHSKSTLSLLRAFTVWVAVTDRRVSPALAGILDLRSGVPIHRTVCMFGDGIFRVDRSFE
jgi:hypothetical protein